MKKTQLLTSLKVKLLLILRPDILKKTSIVLVTLVLLTLPALLFPWQYADEGTAMLNNKEMLVKFRTTSPKKISDEDRPLVLGKVLSNETANVYSRRNGIVEDIFFDIGDRVEKGQVLALLLPPGVDGENTALINEKKAHVNRAYSNLSEARKVAQSVINQEKIKLQEKQIALEKMTSIQEATVNKAQVLADTTRLEETSKVDTASQEVKLIRSQLQLLDEQLVTSKRLQESVYENDQENISQSLEQLKVSFIDVVQVVEHVLLGTQSRENDRFLDTRDVRDNIGFHSPGELAMLVSDFNVFKENLSSYGKKTEDEQMKAVHTFISDGQSLLSKTLFVLSESVSTPSEAHGTLTELSNRVNNSQERLLRAKEKYQDAQSGYLLSTGNQNEKITLLENKIESEREKLILAEKKLIQMKQQQEKNTQVSFSDLEKTEAMRDADIELLKAQVSLAEENIKMMEAQQNKRIAAESSGLQVAQAQLQKEIAKSGNTEIKSPFSGVVSKRNISVGEMVSMGMPAFEMIDVKTSLAEIAKREIQFFLPEELHTQVQVGQLVEFSLTDNDAQVYKATISRISPQVDSESHTITVQAKLDDSLELAHNLSIRVRLSEPGKDTFQLPSVAIRREENGENSVWLLENEKPVKQSITVLGDDGEFAEVTGNVDEDLDIILDPPEIIEQKLENLLPSPQS